MSFVVEQIADAQLVYEAVRICVKCKQTYPNLSGYWYTKRICRECRNEYQRSYRRTYNCDTNVSKVYVPGIKQQRIERGGHTFIAATVKCRCCGEKYAPYTALWSDPSLCVFCKEDIALIRRIVK